MRLSCPACGAVYDIPDHVMDTGSRRLRCARCAHEWVPQPTAAAAEWPAPPSSPPPSPAETPARAALSSADFAALVEAPVAASPLSATIPLAGATRAAGRSRASIAMVAGAWAISLAMLAGAGLAAWRFRDAVQAAWPPSQVVYAALGLG